MGNFIDSRCKLVLTHPAYLKQLMQNFVREDFVSSLDFSSVKQLTNSFVSDRARRKESDLVFSIQCHGQTSYIILEIELQSKDDKTMPLRMAQYVTQLYESLLKTNKARYSAKNGQIMLPPVFPLVLYTGEKKWTTPTNICSIIMGGLPKQYVLQMEYYPVLVNELDKETLLTKIRGALSAVFLLETSTPDDTVQHGKEIIKLVEEEHDEAVRKVFGDYYKSFLSTTGSDWNNLPDVNTIKLEESNTMYDQALKELKIKCKTEGKLEGKLEGKREMAVETARKLKALQMLTVEQIAVSTNLPIEEVQAL